MDPNVKNRVYELLEKFKKMSNNELKNYDIIKGDENSKAIPVGIKGKKIVYIPSEFFNMVISARDKALESREFNAKNAEAFKLANSRVNREEREDAINNFDETRTQEQISQKARLDAKGRRARINIAKKREQQEHREIKQKKFNNAREKHGKKIRNVILVLGLGTAAITGAVQGISSLNANAAETNRLNEQYSNLSTEQIKEISMNNIKDQISEGTNANKDDIKIYDAKRTSQGTEVTVKIGDEYYTHTNEYKEFVDFNDDSLDRNISTLILEIKEADTKQKSIEALKHSINMKEKSKMKIKQKGNVKKLTTEEREKGDEER